MVAEPKLARIQAIVLPLLRADHRLDGVTCGTWGADVDYREFPYLNVRRIGGTRNQWKPTLFAKPVIELTAYGTEGLAETEELYETALEVLYDAVKHQTQTPRGYLHSIKETMGATQFPSKFQDSWRIQGLIQLGERPPRIR